MPIDLSTLSIPTVGQGIIAFIVYIIGFYVFARFLVRPLTRRALRRTSRHLVKPVTRLVYYTTMLIGILVSLNATGYGGLVGAFGTIIAAGTVAVGFATKDTLNAFVSGIFLLIDEPFKIGDKIEWDGHSGRVRDISIRTTRVQTFDDELLTVPNNILANAVIRNPVANNRLRVKTTVGIGYDEDIDEVKNTLLGLVAGIDGVLDDPAPDVKVTELADSVIKITAFYWLHPEDTSVGIVKDQLLQSVKETFEDEGINLPYPTVTIAGDSLKMK